jgi:hypothetical protein
MQITGHYLNRLSLVAFLIFGLILSPIAPSLVLAAEMATDTQDRETGQLLAGTNGGAATGVDVTGTPAKTTPAGKAVLAPPSKETAPKPQTSPAKNAEPQKTPKSIGGSAVAAGSTGVESSTHHGVSMGWKITGAVLGIGLLVGLAGGGGGGGGGGATTPPTH